MYICFKVAIDRKYMTIFCDFAKSKTAFCYGVSESYAQINPPKTCLWMRVCIYVHTCMCGGNEWLCMCVCGCVGVCLCMPVCLWGEMIVSE